MFTFQTTSLFFSVLLLALISGLFYSYSCSVNPGLGKLSDLEYLRAMQSINEAILNPWFFLTFMGTLFALPLCTWLHYSQPPGTPFYFLLASTILYTFGVFGVTIACNVPLNEALARFDIDAASASEISAQRLIFEKPWNNYHFIRTVSIVLSLITALLAVFKK